jgi:hypothetical protein
MLKEKATSYHPSQLIVVLVSIRIPPAKIAGEAIGRSET